MNQAEIDRALEQLAAVDPEVAAALSRSGTPGPRRRPADFSSLLGILVSQQLSTHAARAIQSRLARVLPQVTPEALLLLPPEALREAGLSRRKVEYATGLARMLVEGALDLDAIGTLDDEAAIAQLTRVRGMGHWSAEIYLMFAEGRQDIFPAADRALQVALASLKSLSQPPDAATARRMVAHWQPWRSAGALFLWHYHHQGRPALETTAPPRS